MGEISITNMEARFALESAGESEGFTFVDVGSTAFIIITFRVGRNLTLIARPKHISM